VPPRELANPNVRTVYLGKSGSPDAARVPREFSRARTPVAAEDPSPLFVHISAVERAGLSNLNEGQAIEYEEVSNRGKTSAEKLKVHR
jgi:cold shock CspA family protein